MTQSVKQYQLASPFHPDGMPSLLDVRDQTLARLEGTARRDLASAFAFLTERCGVDLASTPATAEAMRKVCLEAEAAMEGGSTKRLANVRSLVSRAVEAVASRHKRLTKGVPLSPAWEALLSRIERLEYRCGLVRFGTYCSAVGLAPGQVDIEALRSFHGALESESFVKSPQAFLKHTIALWNMAGRSIDGWPNVVLSTPFAVEFQTFPLVAFPASFQMAVTNWKERMMNPDPLDLSGPSKALRPTTIKGDIVLIRRFASALVRRGIVPIEAVTGFSVFFDNDNFKEGLRQFIKKVPAGKTPDLRDCGKIARKISSLAKYELKFGPEAMAPIARIVKNVSPILPREMGRRNRDRLDQFDDPTTVRRLLNFPRAEAARALAKESPIRRANGMKRALAVSILIDTGLRVLNLRSIHIDRHLRRVQDRVLVSFDAEEVKNSIALCHELSPETVEILDLYLAEHHGLLPGCEGRFLFPGQDGGPLSYNAMADAVGTSVRKRTGIAVSPHLYRHIIAKIVVDKDPTLYVAVSHHLGHKSISTTMQSYLGSQSRVAGRALSTLVEAARDEPAHTPKKQRRLRQAKDSKSATLS